MSENSNAIRFLDAYASIESSLNKLTNRVEYVPFKSLLGMAAKNNRIVKNHLTMLKEYADLRNAIVHERGREQEIIAEPSDSVTEDIEHIASLLKQDQNIMNYVTKPVIKANVTTSIKEAYSLMAQGHADKLPIYEAHTFVGMITMKEIAGWILEGNPENSTVVNVKSSHKHRVVFMRRAAEITDAIKVFESSLKQQPLTPVIIVTENGKEDESPLGILSSSDLARILVAVC